MGYASKLSLWRNDFEYRTDRQKNLIMDYNYLNNLVQQRLSIMKIAKASNCSGVNVRYWLKKYKLKTIVRKKLTAEQLSKNRVFYVSRRRKELKIKAIEYKGGVCSRCGYDKCTDAFDFHHVLGEKDFGIGSKGYTRSWERVKIELDKCILVCANCHREIHYEDKKSIGG